MIVVPIVAALRPAHAQDLVARDHLAGRHGRHHGDARAGGPGRRADPARGRAHRRLHRLGRRGAPQPGRRHPDPRGAPARPGQPGPAGGLRAVEEGGRRRHARPDRHARGPDGQGAQRARCRATGARTSNRSGDALGLQVRVVRTDGLAPVGRGIGPALEARDVLAVLRREADAPADLRAARAGAGRRNAGIRRRGAGQAAASRSRPRCSTTAAPGPSSRRSARRRAACASRPWPRTSNPSRLRAAAP